MAFIGNTGSNANSNQTGQHLYFSITMPAGSWQIDSMEFNFGTNMVGGEQMRPALYKGGASNSDPSGAVLVEDFGIKTAAGGGELVTSTLTTPEPATTGDVFWLVLMTGLSSGTAVTFRAQNTAGNEDIDSCVRRFLNVDISTAAADPLPTATYNNTTPTLLGGLNYSAAEAGPNVDNIDTDNVVYPGQNAVANGTELGGITTVVYRNPTTELEVTQTIGTPTATTVPHTVVRGGHAFTKDQDGNSLGGRDPLTAVFT